MFTYLVLPFGSAPLFSWKNTDFMYVLCAAEWSFRAISYRFVHRRTSRFGSRFGSKRGFKNMVELFSQKNARKSSEIKRFRSFLWQATPIKISAVFLAFSMVSAFWGKVFGACCFILLVAAVQPKKILWDLWNFVRSARFCQRSPLWRLSCLVRFRS